MILEKMEVERNILFGIEIRNLSKFGHLIRASEGQESKLMFKWQRPLEEAEKKEGGKQC